MIVFGYTGTRYGMTPSQCLSVELLLKLGLELGPIELRHGDCDGGDKQAHYIALRMKKLGAPVRLVIHPPADESHRAFCEEADVVLPAKTHFARNRDIVDACHGLIVGPLQQERQSYGGTWYTYDYAMKRGKTAALCLRTMFDRADYPSIISYATGPNANPSWPTRHVRHDERP